LSNPVIKVENLSKQYRLGNVGLGSLSHDLNRWWYNVRGKEDPYLKIGEENDRSVKGISDYVWALRDINFEVKQGEVLGIIGRNGAGKSTLLKILSRTTTPTTGQVKIKGRVASLLEVGTGFHPELTGRENIFLNGAILGMTKQEIKSKLDEIVDFSGVERYIDTPVKRYSSGMYVRLAFGVAAHLDPEILIIDEVLAVGDAEFQKKAIGKMKQVSQSEGRTVLFVSHNLDAIKNLCNRSLILENGLIFFNGETEKSLDIYLSKQKSTISKVFQLKNKVGAVYFKDIKIKMGSDHILYFNDTLTIEMFIFSENKIQNLECSFQIFDLDGQAIVYNWISTSFEMADIIGKRGEFLITICIPNVRLYKGEYYFGFNLADPRGKVVYDKIPELYPFEVNMGDLINEFGWNKGVGKYIENITTSIMALNVS
jgi:lipopolysaccharide transport system ATP-binding protein